MIKPLDEDPRGTGPLERDTRSKEEKRPGLTRPQPPSGISLQELRRRIYVKSKSDSSWRFWGLYVHVCKGETLREAYRLARRNHGAPGVDGVTFADIEAQGVEEFLEQIQNELMTHQYRPMRLRKQEIPKDEGRKVRVLSIPCIRDRVVQGALKLILEPIFEADFQPGSFGYRPRRNAHDAIRRVSQAVVKRKWKVIDLDLKSYFDQVKHSLLLAKVAKRVRDDEILQLLKQILKISGKRGVPQGGVISPLLSNIYLNEVDVMLEKAKAVTRKGRFTYVEYARFADDLIVLVDVYHRHDWLYRGIARRLREEFAKLEVPVNEEKSRSVNLGRGERFSFLGFDFRVLPSRQGKWRAHCTPRRSKRTALLRKLKEVFRHYRSQPIPRVLDIIHPILRGWTQYFAVGNSATCLRYIRDWVEKKVRRHLMRARKRPGYGWKRWSRAWLYQELGLFDGYRVRYLRDA